MKPEITLFHEDERGAIYHLKLDDDITINLLYSKKGTARAGDIHPNKQYNVILKGSVNIFREKEGKDEGETLFANHNTVTEPGIPHLFDFAENTIMLEWWDGPFECKYHKKYRDIIEKHEDPFEALAQKKEEIYTPEEKEKVLQRLKEVQYID